LCKTQKSRACIDEEKIAASTASEAHELSALKNSKVSAFWMSAFNGDKKYHNLRTHLDWSLGFDKTECARNSYVKGIAQSGWHIKGILCVEALQSLGNKCKERAFDRGDDRGFMGPSDWQVGYSKGQCGLNEYLAGLSTKKGVPHSILCCQ
jgi:hypothetical protein